MLSFRNSFSPTTLRLEFGLTETVRRFETTENGQKASSLSSISLTATNSSKHNSPVEDEAELTSFDNIEKTIKPSTRKVTMKKDLELCCAGTEKSSLQPTATVCYLSSFNGGQ
jgi:hypothetical protein